LPSDEEKKENPQIEITQESFRDSFKFVGYNISQCMKPWMECRSALNKILERFDLEMFRGNLIRSNVFLNESVHDILKLIPERGFPWKGFASLILDFRLEWASNAVEQAVTLRLGELLLHVTRDISEFLSTWKHEDRILLGSTVKRLFHVFAEEQVLHSEMLELEIEEWVNKKKKGDKQRSQDNDLHRFRNGHAISIMLMASIGKREFCVKG
jgi:hypothetical protein